MASNIEMQLNNIFFDNAELLNRLKLASNIEEASVIIKTAALAQNLDLASFDIPIWLENFSKEREKLSANELDLITAGFGGVAIFTSAAGTPPNKPKGRS
ncbi:MAG TPA: hypothetical protein VF797_02340 [Noviherbaspirillum sp.]